MAKKSRIEYEFKCESCGHIQEVDKEKSNSNWNIISTKCTECGEKVVMKLKQ